MPAKKQKQSLDHDTMTVDSGYGAIPTEHIGSSMGTDTITLSNTLWSSGSSGSITSPYTITTGNGYYSNPLNGLSPAVWTTTGTSVPPNNVHIDADGLTMKAGADIKIGGKSLTQAIEKIEERLGILHPNSELEDRWEQLKELRKQYVELEKDLLEKEKLVKILKEA
jgi:hypothetical protein